MSTQQKAYELDPHIAEIHDQTENYTDDIALIQRMLGETGPLRIFEPFCGTGRIVIPLAQVGHAVVGLDLAQPMLDRARLKIAGLPGEVRERITLLQGDALAGEWPSGFDLVILGANCLFEFESPEEQLAIIRKAAASLRPGGWLFVDNNARRGPLDESALQWRGTWPSGICDDGTRIESESAIVRIDPVRNQWYKTRTIRIIAPSEQEAQYYDETCRHPVSMEEVCRWLDDCGLTVLALFGSRRREPFTPESGRAIFWAQKLMSPDRR